MNIYENITSSKDDIKRAHGITRALRHPLRLQLIELLEKKGKLMVTELFVALRLEQSVCSQHLAILRKAGIVKAQRDGKHVFYTIDESSVGVILETLSTLNK
jgi:DNA-binding transcriptional ArsR family regulator